MPTPPPVSREKKFQKMRAEIEARLKKSLPRVSAESLYYAVNNMQDFSRKLLDDYTRFLCRKKYTDTDVYAENDAVGDFLLEIITSNEKI